MNNTRRQELFRAKLLLQQALTIVKDAEKGEEMAFDNLTEGLQQTRRGCAIESNIDIMDEIDGNISDTIELFDDIE